MSKITKVTKGISIDKDLLEIADQLLPNRSEAAQKGLIEAVYERLDTLNDELRKDYEKRLKNIVL